MAFDIERFKILSPEAQQIVFDKKGLSPEAQTIIRQKMGISSEVAPETQPADVSFQMDPSGEFPIFEGDKPYTEEPLSPESVSSRERMSEFYTPALKYGLGAVGGLVGSPIAPPFGGVGGFAGGFAGGGEVAKNLDIAFGIDKPEDIEARFIEAGKNIARGAREEIYGQGLFSGLGMALGGLKSVGSKAVQTKAGQWLKKTFNSVGMSSAAIEKKAAKVLKENTSIGRTIDDNVKQATKLQEQIPNLRFTRGQLADDAAALTLERELMKEGTGAKLADEHRQFATEALGNYYKSVFPERVNIGDTLDAIRGVRAGLEEAIAPAEQQVVSKISYLEGVTDIQAVGRAVRVTLTSAKKAVRKRAKRFYDEIPKKIRIKTQGLHDRLAQIKKGYDPTFEGPENYPGDIIDGVLKEISPKVTRVEPITSAYQLQRIALKKAAPAPPTKDITFGELRKLRTRVMTAIRVESRSPSANDIKLDRLRKVQQSIEGTIDQLGQRTDRAGELYRKASKFYKEDYAIPYKEGVVARVLQPGKGSEGYKIGSASVAKELFGRDKLDQADQFIKAVGGHAEARQAIRDYAAFDLIETATNTQTGKLVQGKLLVWMARHKSVLRKFGLEGDFRQLPNAQQVVDDAYKSMDLFDKTEAGKMLGVDPGKAIRMAFSGVGKRNSVVVVRNLLKSVEGNKAAEDGIRKAFGDFIMKQADKDPTKLFPLIKEYSGAMRELYRKQPEKLKVLMRIRKAYEILDRKPPLGARLDTPENILKTFSKLMPGALHSWTVNITRAATRIFTQFRQDQLNDVLLRAAFDPDYAQTIMMVLDGAPEQVIRQRLGRHLYAIYGQAAEGLLPEGTRTFLDAEPPVLRDRPQQVPAQTQTQRPTIQPVGLQGLRGTSTL